MTGEILVTTEMPRELRFLLLLNVWRKQGLKHAELVFVFMIENIGKRLNLFFNLFVLKLTKLGFRFLSFYFFLC